ncbi:MAG: hypothetical protein V7K32_00300 [Nostoc sp.]|uniref:hypothetical protein n=1 Tax=Nostoc sp. TaxID=1180 RepID=UPI002FFB2465
MAKPTLAQIFGANATQDAATLTIHKADLPRLTASASNTAESLLTGILLLVQLQLLKSNFDTNLEQSIYIESGFPAFTFRGNNNASYRVDSLTISLAKPDTSAIIDPDDY